MAADLSEEDRKALLADPEYAHHHFGLGLFIRNRYIYKHKEIMRTSIHPDELSNEVFDQVMEIVKESREESEDIPR